MALIKNPDRTYQLGETLPPIGQKVVSWPWGGTPSLTQWSLVALKYPLGTIIYDVIDGHPVIVQIQTHDSYGAHPEWGIKPHKGTSVFVPVTTDDSGKTVAVRDPPDGWGSSPIGHELRRARPGIRGMEQQEVRWSRDPFSVASVYIAQGDTGVASGSSPTSVTQSALSKGKSTMEFHNWKEHFSRIPKLGVLAGTAVAGALAIGGPVGAVIGLAAGLFIDKEVRGGPWLPSFHGEGTWKVFRFDPKTAQFFYVDVVNAGSQGAAVDEATEQVFSAKASKPYDLPGYDSVYITSGGDVFRIGLEG